jgi:hypothetical protein
MTTASQKITKDNFSQAFDKAITDALAYLDELARLYPGAKEDALLDQAEWGVSGFQSLPKLNGSSQDVRIGRACRILRMSADLA